MVALLREFIKVQTGEVQLPDLGSSISNKHSGDNIYA